MESSKGPCVSGPETTPLAPWACLPPSIKGPPAHLFAPSVRSVPSVEHPTSERDPPSRICVECVREDLEGVLGRIGAAHRKKTEGLGGGWNHPATATCRNFGSPRVLKGAHRHWLEVSGRCLGGVWEVSGRCLKIPEPRRQGWGRESRRVRIPIKEPGPTFVQSDPVKPGL